MNEHYDAETYKHVLLPVYSTAYRYKNKTYTVLINGQTGRVKGEYPKSVAKITLDNPSGTGSDWYVLPGNIWWRGRLWSAEEGDGGGLRI